MAKGISPTSRTLKWLREAGYVAEVVEKTIPRCFIKRDYIHCIDVLAFRKGEIVGVQTTSGSNHAARRNKSLAIPELKLWLEAGGKFVIQSWSKPATGRKWVLRQEEITLDAFQQTHGVLPS